MKTEIAISDLMLREKFSRLPETVFAKEVYTINALPRAKEDLGLKDLKFMTQGAQVEQNVPVTNELWSALRRYEVSKRDDLDLFLKEAKMRAASLS